MNIGRGDCVIELQHTEFKKKKSRSRSELRMEISDLYGEEKIGNEANLIFNIQFPFISIFISAKNYF